MKPPSNFSRNSPFICRLEFFVLCLIFLIYRVAVGTFFNLISDCDEVFNYWEPVHFVSSLPFGSTSHQNLTHSRLDRLSLTPPYKDRYDSNNTFNQDDAIPGHTHNKSSPNQFNEKSIKNGQAIEQTYRTSPNLSTVDHASIPYYINPSSMQTWEYSPKYALRSYLYIISHCILIWLSQFIHWLFFNSISSFTNISDGVKIFFMTRGLLSLITSLIELHFALSIKSVLGRRIATLYLLINLLSPGTFLAANQMLPSTSFMLFSLLSFSNFMKYRFPLSLLFAVIGTLVCWPFPGIIYIPLGLITLRRFGIAMTLGTLTQSIIIVLSLMIGIDYFYYGKFVITPLNIVLYNFGFGGGGGGGKSVLYGVESWTFYVRNLLLNFNVFLLLGGLGLLIMLRDMFRNNCYFANSTASNPRIIAGIKESLFVMGTPIPLWFGLMSLIPHKEERFLTVIYPFLCLSSALVFDWIIGRPQSYTHLIHSYDEEAGISKKHDDWKKQNQSKSNLLNIQFIIFLILLNNKFHPNSICRRRLNVLFFDCPFF